MYWGWDQLALFAGVWTCGAIAFAIAERLTRKSSRLKRICFCSLLLAVALAPSIIITHGMALAPAVFILVMAPFVPPVDPTYAALLGAMPIAIVWLVVAAVWAGMRS